MVYRKRNVQRWNERFSYKSVEEFFLNRPKSGVHSVLVSGQWLDLLIEDRNAPTTLVVFHSSLSNRVRTVPALQGSAIAEASGVNLVAVADPALEMGDLDLGWFFGTKQTGPLKPILTPLIKHAIRSLGTKRTILFGASGGGYAAMDFGESFARAIVLALNPRVNLNRRPMARLDPYYEAAHNATTKEEKIDVARRFINGSLTQKYAHGLPFDLCLFQNSGDEAYWNNQFSPFVEVAAGDNRLFVRTENTGSGHTPVPKELVHEMLSRLASGDDQEIAIKSAGFSRTEGSFKTTTRRLYFRVLRKGQRDVRTGQAWIAKLMGRRTERDS